MSDEQCPCGNFRCCCGEYSWSLEALEARRALRCLAANLAATGALCESFRLAEAYESNVYSSAAKHAWHPGCGRHAPGKEAE